MKTIKILTIVLTTLLFQSCATIFGGAKYTAYVQTNDKEAVILVDGNKKGIGYATFLQKRTKDLNLEVISKKCDDYKYLYGTQFRATIVANLLTVYLFLPAIVIDLATGASNKPNMADPGVDKINTDGYRYTIDLENCKVEKN